MIAKYIFNKNRTQLYTATILFSVIIMLLLYSLPLRAGEPLSLINVLELGLANNAQIKNSRLDLEIAGDELQLARQSLYPQIDIQSSYTRMEKGPEIPSLEKITDPDSGMPMPKITTKEGPKDNYNTQITIQQPLYAGGRIRLGVKQAQMGQQLTAIQSRQQQSEVLYQIIEAYYNLLMVKDRVEIEKDALELVQEHKRLAEATFAAGTTLKTDLLQVEIEESKAKQRITEAENQMWLARERLINLIGIETSLQLAEPTLRPQSQIDQLDFEDLYQQACQYRPEIKSLSLNEKMTQTNLQLKEKSHYPSFYLTGNYSWQDDQLSLENGSWNVTISGSMNIFDGGKTNTNQSKIKKQLTQLQQSKHNLLQMVELEVRKTLMDVEESRTNIKVQQLNLEKARENLQLEKRRFEAGTGRSVDVLNAQTTLKQTQVALSQAQYKYDRSLYNLLYKTGKLQKFVKENINNDGGQR